MEFTGKTYWLTGASSGIGEAVAYELAKHRTRLILSGRNKEALDKIARRCIELGSTVHIEPFDLVDMEAMKASVVKTLADGEKVSGLFNFGGISQRSFAIDTPLDIDRTVMEINFFGTVAMTKYLLPHMVANGGGFIVVTSSVVGKFGIPYRSAYSASKHALHGFFESLRAENVQNNIQVTMVLPGRIVTNISKNAITKTGEKYGIMDKGQAGGMSAEKSAKIILKAVKNGRKEILYGGKETLMVHVRRWFPRLFYFLASRVKPL
jgi:dehydrogenase/reductase SDR family member 7B